MNAPLRVFVGYDERQPVAYSVLQHSIHRHASVRVQIEPLMLDKLPLERRGLTAFTFSRYLVPWLCDYEGWAAFLDPDTVVTADIADLFRQGREMCAVQVMQDQPRFEWPSVMLFNCVRCKALTPRWVDNPMSKPQELDWGERGTFGREWNHLVGTADPNEDAKLYHFTEGIPIWNEVAGRAEDKYWFEAYEAMKHTVSWQELMGGSVHAKPVIARMLARYGMKIGQA